MSKMQQQRQLNLSKQMSKSQSKAKSANEPLTTTKPCGHKSTLDGGNARPRTAGTPNLWWRERPQISMNSKTWTPGITLNSGNVKLQRPGTRNIEHQEQPQSPRMPYLRMPNLGSRPGTPNLRCQEQPQMLKISSVRGWQRQILEAGDAKPQILDADSPDTNPSDTDPLDDDPFDADPWT